MSESLFDGRIKTEIRNEVIPFDIELEEQIRIKEGYGMSDETFIKVISLGLDTTEDMVGTKWD